MGSDRRPGLVCSWSLEVESKVLVRVFVNPWAIVLLRDHQCDLVSGLRAKQTLKVPIHVQAVTEYRLVLEASKLKLYHAPVSPSIDLPLDATLVRFPSTCALGYSNDSEI